MSVEVPERAPAPPDEVGSGHQDGRRHKHRKRRRSSRPADPRPRRPTQGETLGFVESPTTEPVKLYRPRRVERLKDRRRRRRRWIALTVVVALGASAVVGVIRSNRNGTGGTGGPLGGPAPSSVAWAVLVGQTSVVAVIAIPGDRRAVAMAIPDSTLVDLPAGAAPDLGEASVTGPGALEAADAALNRRVGHYLLSSLSDVATLVDRLGKISVVTEFAFDFEAETLGPGPLKMTGAQVSAYLEAGTDEDRTARWEDVLAGLLQSDPDPSAWQQPLGTSDDAAVVSNLLIGAHEAPVIELPTAPEVGGGVKPDPQAIPALIRSRLGDSVGTLVRIIVQNANGEPGQGFMIGQMLAPAGFRVVASQNATTFTLTTTKIVASSERFVSSADLVQQILGAGKVYLGSQPTGIADVTIVVGKDFKAG